jgi:hypothetical protein
MGSGDRPTVPWRVRPEAAPREASAWLISLAVHFLFFFVFSLITRQAIPPTTTLVLTSMSPDEMPIEESPPPEFRFDPLPSDQVGSRAMGGLGNVTAPSLRDDMPEVPALELEIADGGLIDARELVASSTGPQADLNQAIKGMAGVGVTGADGAIDRITQEILLSLEERPTLVVWFFDQSASLQIQRAEVLRRFHRVYDELGAVQSAGAESFVRHQDMPLLSSVVAFGSDVQFLIDSPTDALSEIKRAVAAVTQDNSGVEQIFTAIHSAANRYKKYRTAFDRNVMFIAFTDEAGDDQDGLDSTVTLCRRLAIPVYIVGVPAPFGRQESLVKWVDPDPTYDQTPQWGRVNQGPESLLPERIRLAFSGFREDETPIDSGFGPFALTRLCYETGGIYFAVHPNRNVNRRVGRGETAVYSAYFSAFFDPARMRRYRPEYVSARQYRKNLDDNPMRQALSEASQMSWLQPLDEPRRRFVVRSESQFARDLTEAQKDAARIEPALEQLSQILLSGQRGRAREIVPRWQVGYDLAMGRVLATKVRAEGYNVMLAQAKGGLKFTKGANNTWRLNPSEEVRGGSRLARDAEQARQYLQQVTKEHEGTPWSLIAQRELDQPLGWTWEETFTEIAPPADRVANEDRSNSLPQDDQPRVLTPPPPRRLPPKL